jgi:hypothetical protein
MRFRFYLAGYREVVDDHAATCAYGPSLFDYDANYGIDVDVVINVFGCAMPGAVGGFAAFGGSINIDKDVLDNAHTLAHELGHSLSLHHTFEGGCEDDEGDEVRDTAKMQAMGSWCQEWYDWYVDDYHREFPWLSDAEIRGYLTNIDAEIQARATRARAPAALTRCTM